MRRWIAIAIFEEEKKPRNLLEDAEGNGAAKTYLLRTENPGATLALTEIEYSSGDTDVPWEEDVFDKEEEEEDAAG